MNRLIAAALLHNRCGNFSIMLSSVTIVPQYKDDGRVAHSWDNIKMKYGWW